MMENRIVIRPHGVVLIILLLLFVALFGSGIAACVLAFVARDEIDYPPWVVVLVGIILIFAGVSSFVQFYIRGAVIFEGTKMLYKDAGADKIFRAPFELDCKEIIHFGESMFFGSFEFAKSCGKKFSYISLHFTKKQNIRILKEIQARGGLQGLDVEELIKPKKKRKK